MDEGMKSDGAIKPEMVPTSPIILNQTIVEPSLSFDSSLVSLPSALQRFRKILPKLDNNDSMAMQNSLGESNNSSTSTMPTSYIVIIPTIDNKKLPTLRTYPPKKLPSTNKKIPTLTITVNRKYDNDQSWNKSINDNDDNTKNENNSIVQDESGKDKDNKVEEVEINHKTLNKLVVFSLDKTSDEISVSFRDNSSVIGRNAKLPGIHMKLRENPPKRKNWDEPEHLKTMYKRAKEDCFTLRSKLRALRNRHDKEKAAIGKLQKKLVELENNTSSTPKKTQKSFETLLKSDIKTAPKNIINEKKLSFVRKTGTIKLKPTAVNKKLLLKLNNNEDIYNFDTTNLKWKINSDYKKFVLKTNKPNALDSSIQKDEAIIMVPNSDVEHFNLYETINGTTLLNYKRQ